MSDKQQTPSNVGRSLILIIVAIIIGTLWFVFQSKNETDKTLDNTQKSQQSQDDDTKDDEYKDWVSYTWEGQGVSFKHPADWLTDDTTTVGRLYVKNTDVNLLKEEMPADFQQVWLSVDTDENTQAREDAIKAGKSNFRVVRGEVKASTVKAGGLTINVYEYGTLGGPTLEAYWSNAEGKRYMATTSTEVGEENQAAMVATLKQLLATVELSE